MLSESTDDLERQTILKLLSKEMARQKTMLPTERSGPPFLPSDPEGTCRTAAPCEGGLITATCAPDTHEGDGSRSAELISDAAARDGGRSTKSPLEGSTPLSSPPAKCFQGDLDHSGAAATTVSNAVMKARDLMTQETATVRPTDSVQHVARVLLANRISAVPVVGEGDELLGIVSEGDLLRRVEVGTARTGSWWVGRQTSSVRQILAEDFVKSHATTVGDLMSRYVITAVPDTPLKDIVALFEINHIKRVPIVEDEKIVGIVSRADFLKALGATPERIQDTRSADDALGEDLMARLKEHSWLRTDLINVAIQDGVVNLWGIVGSDAEKSAVRVAAEVTDGVKSVNDYLIIRTTVFES